MTFCPATAKSEFVHFISLLDSTGGRVQVFAAQTLCVCGGMGMDVPPMVTEDCEVMSHKSLLAADGWAASSGSIGGTKGRLTKRPFSDALTQLPVSPGLPSRYSAGTAPNPPDTAPTIWKKA